jgi:hypothetical protein
MRDPGSSRLGKALELVRHGIAMTDNQAAFEVSDAVETIAMIEAIAVGKRLAGEKRTNLVC